ncbi:hypothetical protein R0137_11010 [Congregibacter brevis]|uniref:Uncharacterized protein n=1 Tax=Congregibacter brevis TaxID=3081201 RepID=A0ABZ0I8W0_9GAMM|nr:hypothetical protein R0137_11010 [Congregibacter sp. IMCC45268]
MGKNNHIGKLFIKDCASPGEGLRAPAFRGWIRIDGVDYRAYARYATDDKTGDLYLKCQFRKRKSRTKESPGMADRATQKTHGGAESNWSHS